MLILCNGIQPAINDCENKIHSNFGYSEIGLLCLGIKAQVNFLSFSSCLWRNQDGWVESDGDIGFG